MHLRDPARLPQTFEAFGPQPAHYTLSRPRPGAPTFSLPTMRATYSLSLTAHAPHRPERSLDHPSCHRSLLGLGPLPLPRFRPLHQWTYPGLVMGWVVSRRPGPPAALQGPPPRLRKAATRTRGATPSFASHGPKRIHGPAGGRPIGARDRGSPHPALSHARPRTKRCRDPRPGLKRTTRSAARQALVSRARSDAATRDPGSNARRAWPHAGISSRAHEAKTRPSTRARTHVALGSNSATRAALAAPERLARRGATRPAATDSDPAGPQCCGAAPRSQNETWPNGPTHTRRCDKQPPAAGHSASVTGTAPRRQPGGPVINSRARPRLTPGPTARPLTYMCI